MKTTIWGIATTIGAPVWSRSATGPAAHAVDDYALELPSEVPVDLDHDESKQIGTITYAEITPQDQLAVVGVVDAPWLDKLDRDVFLSGTYFPEAPVDRRYSFIVPRVRVAGMSLTFNPLTTGAQRVQWMAGDLRSSSDRYAKWPISWRHNAPLLARALDHLGSDRQLRTRSASRIVDRRGPDYSHLVGRSLSAEQRYMLAVEQADAMAEQFRPSGPLEYRSGRILSVR